MSLRQATATHNSLQVQWRTWNQKRCHSNPLTCQPTAEIDAEILAEQQARQAQTAQLPGARVRACETAFLNFRDGWLAKMKSRLQAAMQAQQAAVAAGGDGGQASWIGLSLPLVKRLIDELRVCLAPILLSQPRFVITYMAKFDLTSWAVQLTPNTEQTYKTFLAPTARMEVTTLKRKTKNSKAKQQKEVRDITQEEKDVAWVTAKWMNNDWLIAPIAAFPAAQH